MTEQGPKGGIRSLRDLPQGIEPGRDLWPQVEAQISGAGAATPAPVEAAPAPRRVVRPRLAWLAAAAMVACVAAGVWIGRSVLPGAAPVAPVADVPRAGGGALQAAWVTDPRYQREHAELMRTLSQQLAALPPASRAKVMASLNTIREAKQHLEEELGKDPGNALLQELLVNTYQDEMRVLTDVREASDAGRGI